MTEHRKNSFCPICQHCPHSELDQPPPDVIAKTEAALIRAADGDVLANDRPPTNESGNPTGPPFMSGVFALLAKLPPDDPASLRINNHMIRYFYEAIPHPVDTLLGERFRRADGSGNNVHMPSVGQAGTTYARTCQSKHIFTQPLPDPALIFDEIFKAPNDKERDPHPGRNSSLTFAFASLVTHSLFRTDPSDWNKNNTSSYFDLSPLYGSNQAEQDAVRIKDGFGRLYPDTFSEGRIVFLPPAAAVLLVIWNRNHNYIAEKILEINEQGRWKNSPSQDVAQRAAQDEEIFQTARLINCGSFMSVVLGDYVAGFLGLTRNKSTWSMKPFDMFRDPNHRPVTRGRGNHVSVEFNILYRWHSVISSKEEKWTLNIMEALFPNKKPGDLTLADFNDALGRLRSGDVPHSLNVNPDPRKRNFGGIKRGPDGRFTDDDLANILHGATEDVAHRYGARGTPEALNVIEILGIQQARRWGACTMNEFRVRMGLEPFASFEAWAGKANPDVAAAARKLYGDINNLELYPGLLAEETMALGPGSGLCAGYTITRAILSDAISLIRGDRYFTTDFTPGNLTTWGIQDVERDQNNPAFGAYLPKLLRRALPRYFPDKSVYTWFPFFIPSETRKNLEKLGLADQYEFDRPTASPKVGKH
ncbi:hypothetical protein OPQ81_005195 [Rhizoctonia solani]|nr:hypothetical protein OPQ81_005195 [Rhizoctonia solani]